ncbi:MAG: hypothetical protein Q4G69_00790 [Planctomycetia bacterium]|nr:hypothetical protein [Planctomycetia bacterium]
MSKIWIYIKRTFCWIFFNRSVIEKHIDIIAESYKDSQNHLPPDEENSSGTRTELEEEKTRMEEADPVCEDKPSVEEPSCPEENESIDDTVHRK